MILNHINPIIPIVAGIVMIAVGVILWKKRERCAIFLTAGGSAVAFYTILFLITSAIYP